MKKTFKKRNPLSGLTFVLILLLSGFTNFNGLAQEKVTGTVSDKEGNPIPGVTVFQKGTQNGNSSDFDGNYSLELTVGQKVLIFSYLGYKTVEIPVSNRKVIDVTLSEEAESLGEIVVVGYGTKKKESVVAAITQMKGKDLVERALGTPNLEQALQGNLPGCYYYTR